MAGVISTGIRSACATRDSPSTPSQGARAGRDPDAAEHLREQWEEWQCGVQLTIIESPYRSLVGPLLAYIDAMHVQFPNKTLTVILPEMVPAHWWEQVLHNQTALRLKAALLFRPGVIVASVPYHLRKFGVPDSVAESLAPHDRSRQRKSTNGQSLHRPKRVVRPRSSPHQ